MEAPTRSACAVMPTGYGKGTDPMSGITHCTTTPTFGPRRPTRLELMGIRFVNDPTDPPAGGYKAPETQEDLDRIITERLTREREKFKDFDALKEKATKYDAIQTAPPAGGGQNDDVTARLAAFEQRVTAAETTATATQTELESARVELLRSQVALDNGIGKDDLVLLTATTKDDLDKQAARIAALNAGSGKIPGQGGGSSDAPTGLAAGASEYEKRHPKK